MTKQEYQEYMAEEKAASMREAASIINRAMHGSYITLIDVTKAEMEYIHDAFNVMNDRIASLEAENTNLKTEIAQLQADNRSLVEQVNQIALKPNQEVIEWVYTLYNPEINRIYNLPTEDWLCIIELFSGKYDLVWWIGDGLDETGWDGYCVDEVKSWAYLPKGGKQ